MTAWQKAIKYAAMAFAILLVVSIFSGILGGIASVGVFFDNDDAIGTELREYPITGNITDLDIDIGAADLVIKTGDALAVQSNYEHLTVEEKNNTLVISEKKRLFVSYSGVRLEITLPEGFVFDNVDIVTGAGKVTVKELSADRLNLQLGAGEVSIDNLTANDKAEIDGGAGKVTINGGVLNDLDLSMGVGEFELKSKLVGDCDLDYGVGNTKLVLIGSEKDYRIELDKGIGEATLEGKKMSDDEVYGSGSNKIDIDGGVGAIEIEFEG